MKITIIGGSGFIGTRLINLLKDEKIYELQNIDLKTSLFFNDITEIGDVRDQKLLKKQLKGTDLVVLLAAQHKDNITPISLYYDTNVTGLKNTLKAMNKNGIKRLVYFSSVSVYGINKHNPNEEDEKTPFNHYGKSKWMAELALAEWFTNHQDWNINVIRPTVIFGERNRGNVYNLLHQISTRHFLMVGKGNNKKSMAYVGNVVSFVKFVIEHYTNGYAIFNYVDKPDFTMNQLVQTVEKVLKKRIPAVHFPYWLGMFGGYCFDACTWITRRKLPISSVRVKKFCATTEFDASKMQATGFQPPYTLQEGLARTLEFEFVHPRTDDITFKSE